MPRKGWGRTCAAAQCQRVTTDISLCGDSPAARRHWVTAGRSLAAVTPPEAVALLRWLAAWASMAAA